LRIRRQRVAGVFFCEVAHGLFRQRIILALHVTDTEIEFVFRCRRWRQSGQPAGLPRIGIPKIERFAGITPAGRTDRRFGRDRELSTAERTRRAGSVRILVGIEGIATAAAWRRWLAFRFRHNRRRSCGLLAIRRLRRRRPVGGAGLRRRHGGDIGLADRSPLRAALKGLQAFFELPVAILQFLVLAGQLPELILELLNAHLRILVVGLRQDLLRQGLLRPRLRTKRQHRRQRRDAGNSRKSG
jgi:hypothetical protein